ncbi:elongation factor P [Candidatus Dojkabacteria bacterium]|uniref:Elongation factor P n=1 Tax=Candidatus Dojkabacteria bacterium TaxID=2099670 RepID=A0A955L7X0_9BACT|nr:elongation factor P [Candidatus Dojkabacteria bacterium]
MATINSNELKEGVVFKDSGSTYIVLKYSHIKKGRGQATIKVKVKNLETSSITILSYTNEQKVESADVEKKSVQFLYSDGVVTTFMDSSDYSQFTLPVEDVEDVLHYTKEGQKVVATYLNGDPVGIELPKSVELLVQDTSDAVSGNTSGNAMKNAVLETGLEIQVPLFIKKGDLLKINTETGTYVSRL